jgi:hypothetical protein
MIFNVLFVIKMIKEKTISHKLHELHEFARKKSFHVF